MIYEALTNGFLTAAVVTYLFGAFIAKQANPLKWSEDTRIFTSVTVFSAGLMLAVPFGILS